MPLEVQPHTGPEPGGWLGREPVLVDPPAKGDGSPNVFPSMDGDLRLDVALAGSSGVT
jgi:hypothetical protein